VRYGRPYGRATAANHPHHPDDAVAQGEYINFPNIIHSPSEFVIDLGRTVPGRADGKIYSRVITMPLHAE